MKDQGSEPGNEKGKKNRPSNGIFNYLWDHRVEIFATILMIAGLVFAFYYLHISGGLVGLAFGLCFFEEVHAYFVQLRDYYVEQGIFKTLMLIGTILYFLISIPAFIIAAAVGYGAIFLIRWSFKK